MIQTRNFAAVSLAALAWSSQALAAEEVLSGPIPEWVVPQVAGAPSEEAADLPVQVLLLDIQQRMEGERQVAYSSVVMKIQTPQGLAAGNISFPWRPEYDDVTVHKVLIRRGDEVIDVLGSGQTFTVLRREQNLEMAMLDGVLTGSMFPEGLQVGDILEITSSTSSKDPVLSGHGMAFFGPFNGQIARAHFGVNWPTSKKMGLSKSDDAPEWKRSRKGGFESAELTLDNVEPMAIPSGAPLRYNFVRYAEASDFASWNDLSRIFIPLYKSASEIPADGALRAEVEKIRAASADPVERTNAALALVQSRIRYVALAMGEGGLVPAAASETWARRYGDCKGKTALLLGILAELGIEAEPVLVSTSLGDLLPQRLPSSAAFDHVIVRVHVGGKAYWLDGTRTDDTDIERLRTPYFDWGLPIVEKAELVRMIPAPLAEPEYDLDIHMDASKGVHGDVPTTIKLVQRGESALATKRSMANFVGAARDRTLREYWRNNFDFVTPTKVDYSFDDSTGEAHILLEGQAKMDWNGVWYETDRTGVGYDANFVREEDSASDAPYAVAYPFYNRTRQTIVLPSGFAEEVDEDAPVDETVAGIEYKRHATLTGNTFFIERTERSLTDEFPASEAVAAEKRLRELADLDVHLRIPATYRFTSADIEKGLALDPGAINWLYAKFALEADAGDYQTAADTLTKGIASKPEDSQLLNLRGIALTKLGKPREAEKDFAAARLLATDASSLNSLCYPKATQNVALGRALEECEESLRLEPDSPAVLDSRGAVLLRMGRLDEALRDFDRALELIPDQTNTLYLRAVARSRKGDMAAAKSDLALVEKSSPELIERMKKDGFVLAGE